MYDRNLLRGNCLIESINCDDGLQCTTESCSPSEGCIINALTGPGCDDGNACTEDESCSSGLCVGGVELNCNDDSVCTDDSESSGCVNTFNNAPCDDGSQCSAGFCEDGECDLEPLDCDDDNICTNDTCVFGQGCVFLANTVACDDNDPCTLNDVCSGPLCSGRTQLM